MDNKLLNTVKQNYDGYIGRPVYDMADNHLGELSDTLIEDGTLYLVVCDSRGYGVEYRQSGSYVVHPIMGDMVNRGAFIRLAE